MRYRKKPVVIEAFQFCNPAREFQEGNVYYGFDVHSDDKGYFLTIPTLEGDMRANEGDWIITGVKGEKYPCKPEIFAATYEPDVFHVGGLI